MARAQFTPHPPTRQGENLPYRLETPHLAVEKEGRKKDQPCCATYDGRARTSTNGRENFYGLSFIALFTGMRLTIKLHFCGVFGMAKTPPFGPEDPALRGTISSEHAVHAA